MEDIKDPFDVLMDIAGPKGRFQKMYTWVIVMGTMFMGALIYMNLILALNVPDHWCFVPGIEKTNLTIDKWKNLTLPIKTDNRGEDQFSSCAMYNVNVSENLFNVNFHDKRETTVCLHGYEYDKEWYDETIATKENWVCDKDLYVTNTFVVSRVSEVVGSLFFGQLGDIYGRRIIFLLSLVVTTAGRALSIVTTSSYSWFMAASTISGLTMTSFFLSPIVVAMEISKSDDRAILAMVQSLGWSIGASLMPLLFWWVKHFIPFMWLTTLPPILFIIMFKYLIESPRWLISKKRFGAAKKQLDTIAKINGRTFTVSEQEMAKMFSDIKEEHVYGVASLFSTWRLAANTIIIGSSCCVTAVSYFTLVLFSSQMGGNPFINFLLQSVVEIPAYIFGKYLTDTIGRRATNSLSFFIAGLICIPVILLASDVKYGVIIVILASILKFLTGITYFAVMLQTMEIYPTCLRQTGQSLGVTLANGVGIMAPYVVYVGIKEDIRYPYYILAVLFFVGGTMATFLPETLYQKLPDTLEDAKLFGKNQKFWSLPNHRKIAEDKAEKEKLNQEKFLP